MSMWSQSLEIARVDLSVERRAGDVLRIVVPFGVISLLVFPLALGADLRAISLIGPAVYWGLGILFGMQVALRQAASDTVERRDLYSLLGVDPAARFVGRTLSGIVLSLGFFIAVLVAMIIIYSPDLPAGWPLPTLVSTVLVAVGLTELGTLAGEVTAGLRNRSSLAPLLVAPLAIPLVLGGSETLESLARGTGILTWVLLLLATDLALAVAGVGLAQPLEETSR